ncbi:hypothetical protein [Sorangium sp. So ce1151]|uniref:hypothetical protein n=1 Tax=Sorangium sp. So ce1151 TaxID=3133332 RepID=UPI003F645AD9
MVCRYAVIRGEEFLAFRDPPLAEPPRASGRYLLERLVERAPKGSVEAELLGRWADLIDDSPRLVWHVADAYATWARGLSDAAAAEAELFDRAAAAKLFDRAALYGCVELEWSSARRAELRRRSAP